MSESIGIWEFPFSALWDTTKVSYGSSSDKQIQIPISDVSFSPITIYWGDGASDEITDYRSKKLLHTYRNSGVYNVRIVGNSFVLGFGNSKDKLKIKEISNFGKLKLDINSFEGCENLNLSKVVDVPLIASNNLRGLFSDNKSLTRIGSLKQIDVSGVVNMTNMFERCVKFNQDISSWNFNKDVVLEDFMVGKSHADYNPTYYDKLLQRFAECFVGKERLQENKIIGMGEIKHTANGVAPKNLLLNEGYIIIDGGQIDYE